MILLSFALICRLAHLEIEYLMNSSGGVAAKSSGLLSVRISLATILDRYFGLTASPLLMSTHLSLMGGIHVAWKHYSRRTLRQTCICSTQPTLLLEPLRPILASVRVRSNHPNMTSMPAPRMRPHRPLQHHPCPCTSCTLCLRHTSSTVPMLLCKWFGKDVVDISRQLALCPPSDEHDDDSLDIFWIGLWP